MTKTENTGKVVFFFSAKQKTKQEMLSLDANCTRKFIDGKEFTEEQDRKFKSNWDDAVIVAEYNNLPLCKFETKRLGYNCADTSSLNITIKRN